MSTTVSYKGQTLTTVSNDTKTLLTEGKYLEDDLTLTDVSGSGATLITKNIGENGTYNASSDSADGYSQVNVAVPNTYTNADEGKVVSDGALVAQTPKNINSNGTHSTVMNNQVVVDVPNSYSQSDEGKVVSNGALVAQTAHADVTPTTSDQTIDTTTNDSIKVKGDADLVASNIKKDVEIFGVTGSYEGSGGGSELLAGILARTATEIVVPDITEIGRNAFYKYTISFTASFPDVTTLALEAFREATGLTAVNLPKIATVTGIAFYGCTALASAKFASAKKCGQMAFYNCSRLTSIVIPVGGSGAEFESSVFSGCSTLAIVDCFVNVIQASVFDGCAALNNVILRKADGVVNLWNINAFSNNTPFASGKSGGTIYIPKALYDHLGDGSSLDYKAATNWSTLDGYGTVTWAQIEGSQYENYYADGTPISS